jgi:hypothetical protein
MWIYTSTAQYSFIACAYLVKHRDNFIFIHKIIYGGTDEIHLLVQDLNMNIPDWQTVCLGWMKRPQSHNLRRKDFPGPKSQFLKVPEGHIGKSPCILKLSIRWDADSWGI